MPLTVCKRHKLFAYIILGECCRCSRARIHLDNEIETIEKYLFQRTWAKATTTAKKKKKKRKKNMFEVSK